MTLKRRWPVFALLGALATSASAQAPTGPGYSWVLKGVTFSACVEFLMEPAAAGKQLRDDYHPIPAASFTPLSPVLRQEIAGDAVHAGWIPAQVCFVEAPTLTAGDRVFTPDRKLGPSEVVGYWAIGASRSVGTPQFDQWYLAELWVNDWHVEKPTEAVYIPVTVFKRTFAPVPESTRHRYGVQIGKTALFWEGDFIGRDSTTAPGSTDVRQIFTGLRGIQWRSTLSTSPQWTRTLPGIFRVEGKDDLATALQDSPIRIFGPMFWGGDARFEFVR
jgi:hypothetical protein